MRWNAWFMQRRNASGRCKTRREGRVQARKSAMTLKASSMVALMGMGIALAMGLACLGGRLPPFSPRTESLHFTRKAISPG